MSNFLANYQKGSHVEDFISDFLEEMFRWKFMAGSKHGKIVNSEYIEKVFSCRYLEPGEYDDGYHGPRLMFEDGRTAVMPDLLFLSSYKENFWVESKASFNPRYRTIDIEEEKFDSYSIIQEHSKKPVWIVLTVVDEENKECEIYSCKVVELADAIFENNMMPRPGNYKKLVYRISIDSNIFRRLVKNKISYQ